MTRTPSFYADGCAATSSDGAVGVAHLPHLTGGADAGEEEDQPLRLGVV